MRVLVYFCGTGQKNSADAIEYYNKWCGTLARDLGAYASLFIVVDGVSMHKLAGMGTNAIGWLRNTFYNDLFVESGGSLYINPAILKAKYVIVSSGGESIISPSAKGPSSSRLSGADISSSSAKEKNIYSEKSAGSDEEPDPEIGINLNDMDNNSLPKTLDPMLLGAHNNKARDSILAAQKTKIEAIDLCGFSRGAVMTFLFAKHLYEVSERKNIALPEINIMAQEPVPGNIIGWGYTMQAHAQSLEREIGVIQRCVVGLGSYYSINWFKRKMNTTLCFNQLCPKPIKVSNEKTNIRPVIYARSSHISRPPLWIDWILMHYAGMLKRNLLLDFNEKSDFDRYAVSGRKKVLGRSITNIPGSEWDSYRIRDRDITSKDSLIARFEDLLGNRGLNR